MADMRIAPAVPHGRFLLNISNLWVGGTVMRAHWSRIVLVLLSVLLPSGLALGQITGTITGTISDQTGAVISNATVTLTATATGTSRTVKTDSSGRYVGSLLPLGSYSISVTAPAFRTARKSQIFLEAQASLEVNFTLAPAGASSTVTVEAGSVAVETAEPSLGQVIHAQQVADLPLNGRNFVELATLTPGATAGNQPGDFFNQGSGSSEVSIRGSYSLSVAGSRENRTQWLYDGVINDELTSGGLSIQPSIDALSQFKVLTYNYPVRYGIGAGPTVLLTSKSGSNQFHGALFEFLRNTDLNSFGYFAPTRPKFNQNQFGGSVGGPVLRTKLFFFFDYQGTRLVEGMPSAAQVPSALQRQGNFTESFPGAPEAPIYDPATTQIDPVTGAGSRTAFAGNILPTGRLDPIALKMLSFFPLPNVPGTLAANYVSVPNLTLTDNVFDFRLDWNISQNDTAFARFSRDQATDFTPSGLPGFGSQPGGFSSNQDLADRGRNLAVSETHVFSGNAVNQFTAGYNRIFDHIKSFGDGTDWNEQLGIPNANLGTYLSSGLLNTQFTAGYWGLGDRGFSPIQDGTNIFQYSDDFELTHGNHLFSIGMEALFYQLNEMGNLFPMGMMTFDNLFTAGFSSGTLNSATGNPIASFLLGLPADAEHDVNFGGTVTGRRWKEFRPYAQDLWKIRPNLSLQFGLAYNYVTTVKEAANRLANFDFTTGKLMVAGVNSSKSAGIEPYALNLEPRLGFAYTPLGPDTSIRGGYGIQHDIGWALGAQGLDLNPPFSGTYAFQSANITPVTTLSQGFPVPVQPDVNSLSGNVYSQNRDFHAGLVQLFNLSVQQALPRGTVLTIAYAGARDSHLQTLGWNLNTPPPNTLANPQSLVPYPNLSEIIGILDRGNSRYDSLQVKAEKNNQHGLYFLLSYTWSKGFDNGLFDNLISMVGVPYYPLVPYPHADRGLLSIDQTNNFAASVLYQLPFGRGRQFGSTSTGLTQQLIGNWQLNVISHMASGFPMGLTTGSNTSGTVLLSSAGAPTNRPNQVCSGRPAHQTINEFFDPSCFVDPAPGQLGNANRTPLYGPDFVNFDGSLFKNINLPDGKSVSFRTEVFNVFNHPQFAQPGMTTDSANFGQITSTVNNPRLIQFALKFLF